MSVNTYSVSGTKATTTVKLPKEIFAVNVDNHQLLKDAYLSYMANGRDNLAKTLKRGEVRGGGKKPWRQKGTGRARFGSTRNPIWRSGGVAFGPSGNENYSRKLSTKAKQKALKQALSLAANSKNLAVIDDFVVKDGKTKTAINLLSKLGSDSRTLIVVDVKSAEVTRSVSNIPEVLISTAKNLNVYDVLNAVNIVITQNALKELTSRLSGGDK